MSNLIVLLVYHAMKKFEGVLGLISRCLTSVGGEIEWSASSFDRFIPREKTFSVPGG